MMTTETNFHEMTRDFVYPVYRNKLAIRIKTGRNDIKTCTLIYWNRFNMKPETAVYSKMKCYARDNLFNYYEIIIDTGDVTRYIRYYFQIEGSTGTQWLNYYGISKSIPQDGFFEYLYTNEKDIFNVPDWVESSVFYQIFPERFFNGDPTNDPENIVQWGSKPTRDNFMGGDLKGIIEKIKYLKDIGVNAIYLNPIFEAPSNHKYDTIDYFKIDTHFGSLDDFKSLVYKCHKNSIRVILDGVFNHCGYYLSQFQDVISNGEASRYKDWFYIENYPLDPDNLNYECVGYYKWMPKLRIGNPEVKDYFLNVAKYWIEETGIDGWRLDVADEVDFTFWQEFRKLVKSIKPECFILAETWRENRDMLKGDQMDSVMNYPLRDALVDFFAKQSITSSELDSRINRLIGAYSKPVHNSVFNIIGSHDTDRFLTLCDNDKRKLKLAAAFQFCLPGIPVIYYGDETGMTGENDPDCRKAMEWDENKQDMEILNWYKKIVNLRKSHPELMLGEFMSNICDDDLNLYGFLRKHEEDVSYIAVNNSPFDRDLELPACEGTDEGICFIDQLTGKEYQVIRIKTDERKMFYNYDLLNYQGKVDVHLPGYEISILKKIKKRG